uniref:Uncharacterized protein n=1 Tax=Candidatus Kentrum sp. LPFa TaxID=2126335 RepID=A0A450XFT4_9GAMM|nr:MAG: hypothetical protein BECKLPF1236C_GA0070990_100588 [Candidatus Kentron sp. LPFa]
MIPLALRRGDVISRGLVTFPENPEQNDQKIRESKERGISSSFLVPDFPGWVSEKSCAPRPIPPSALARSANMFFM